MAYIVLLRNHTPLQTQAQTHQAHSEHISSMIAAHPGYEDAFFAATGASEFPDLGNTYAAWWSSFSLHLEAHDNAHQGMVSGLTGNVRNFYMIDGQPPPV